MGRAPERLRNLRLRRDRGCVRTAPHRTDPHRKARAARCRDWRWLAQRRATTERFQTFDAYLERIARHDGTVPTGVSAVADYGIDLVGQPHTSVHRRPGSHSVHHAAHADASIRRRRRPARRLRYSKRPRRCRPDRSDPRWTLTTRRSACSGCQPSITGQILHWLRGPAGQLDLMVPDHLPTRLTDQFTKPAPMAVPGGNALSIVGSP